MRTVRRLLIASVLLAAAPALAGEKDRAAPAAQSTNTPTAAAPAASTSSSARTGADELDTAARQLFLDAIDAYERGDNDKAYSLLLAAWKVKPHWQIAASLAAVELLVGKPVDAANHFAFYQREAPADRKEKAAKLLAEATAKVGTVVVTVEPVDAELLVDGVATGAKSGEPIYVEADIRHKITARKGSDTSEAEVLAGAGKRHELSLKIEPGGARSRVPPAVLGGVGIASVITGAVLIGVAENNGAVLRANAPRGDNGELLCRKSPTPGSPTLPGCDAWRSKAVESSTMGNAGIGMVVAGGVLAAAATAWWLWPSGTKASAAQWRMLPVVTGDGAGAQITGRF